MDRNLQEKDIDSVAIPSSNYSLRTRDGWFVISFSHVPAKNAKPFKPAVGGVVMLEVGALLTSLN